MYLMKFPFELVLAIAVHVVQSTNKDLLLIPISKYLAS